jgi:hypothetical protein
MLRSLSLATVASLFALTIGCSGSPEGASDSTDDALSAKSSGFFLGKGPGLTGGVSVALANAKTTACPNGSKKSVCAVLGVDFGKLNLDSATETKLSTGFRDGYVVVKGKLDSTSSTLVAEKAWLGASKADAQDLDQLFLVNLEVQNRECTANSACSGPTYRQATVNDSSSKAVLEINDVSLDGPGSKAEVAKGEDEMNIGAEGLLVLGHDVALVSNHNAETTRTLLATNFFLPVDAGMPYPLSCMTVTCAQGMHCEMKGINGGSVPTCIQN